MRLKILELVEKSIVQLSLLFTRRFGRAALTVASISLDYRRSIYTKDSAALYESNRPGM